MLVTLFSDAGLCDILEMGSWGGWVKSERGIGRGGGILRDPVRDSGIAEARAVLNSIHVGLTQGVIHPGDHIIIQTDNNAVPNIIDGVVPNSRAKRAAPIMEKRESTRIAARELLAKYRLTIEWRHVKGHQGFATKRNSVNTYCDQVATFFLRLGRLRRDPRRFTKLPGNLPFGIDDPRLPSEINT